MSNLRICLGVVAVFMLSPAVLAQDTRLLRQPTLSAQHVAFAYGADLWVVGRDGGLARRLTSTPAGEWDPHFSPDGRTIAFTSNRAGQNAVYVVSVDGGTPRRLTWYPADADTRGWTPDGQRVLYTSSRGTAPSRYGRLWTVGMSGGPAKLLSAPMGFDGSFSPSGKRMVIEGVSRWDAEWRNYRGGQNKPLLILDLETLEESPIPSERTSEVQPVWLGETVYFLSDRDWVRNIWSYHTATHKLRQLTEFEGADVKSLSGHRETLAFEREGYLHTLNLVSGAIERLVIEVRGDFPWSETRWEDVGGRIRSAALSPSGKRALFEARGEIFSVPAKKGDTRNLSRSSGAADRAPIWSPKGDQVAWFSDSGEGYELLVASQDGLSEPQRFSIGESKMVWEPVWSPDGDHIALVDNKVRIRVLNLKSGELVTADTGGINLERGRLGITWSPDSNWLAYAKTFANNFRRVVVWSRESGESQSITDRMADSFSPAWSQDGKRVSFLASTDVALGSGWANTRSMKADPNYSVYTLLLTRDQETPFSLESDEEESREAKESSEEAEGDELGDEEPADQGEGKGGSGEVSETERPDDAVPEKGDDEAVEEKSVESDSKDKGSKGEKSDPEPLQIDFEQIERRIMALPMPSGRYRSLLAGPDQTLFVGESKSGSSGQILHKFSFKKREASVFLEGVRNVIVSHDAKKLLYRSGSHWSLSDTASATKGSEGRLKMDLRMRLNRLAEWQQIFDESWRYLRDFFYDPNMHGRDWNVVRERYAPLVPHVRHRSELNVVLDQMSGEMSVGHSFVFGGDTPEVDRGPGVGLLGADLESDQSRWRLKRIYTYENWNPGLRAPLDEPGLKIDEGNYLLSVNGVEFFADDNFYRHFEGLAGRQVQLRVNSEPTLEGAWTITVKPVESEVALRRRAWIEDNRRQVDALSEGRLAYVWLPNTGGPGLQSFDRYYFAQQDKEGAVIDERFNGGGLLDDYMVDLMTRRLRAGISNEVPNGRPFRLPAGILGPKVLLINELAGSGGDFFPWVFRQQKAGLLIGTRTWGGLVKSSVHYPLIDGGALTAPDNAVFDPINHRWIAENVGVAPDIEVLMDAQSVAKGRDPQLERAVAELLRTLEEEPLPEVTLPPYPTPAQSPRRSE